MVSQNLKIKLNKDKKIGKVLFIVEGTKTEPYILKKLFTQIFNYEIDTKIRDKKYKRYNSKYDDDSRICVINTESSNIKSIKKDDGYLDNLFAELIENDFDIDNAAIYYIFDRDDKSNTNSLFIQNLLSKLVNSRDNPNFDRQGMLLLSYPSIESFTLSCYRENSFEKNFETGKKLKTYLGSEKLNCQRLSEDDIKKGVSGLLKALDEINDCKYDLDDFSQCNEDVFEYEEKIKKESDTYKCLSLFVICLIDLGLIEFE